MDNLTWPNTGVHPGATMCMPAIAVAQERGIGGRELIAAVVAGAEVMIRIGRATKHNNEGRGFHAPGTTGPFGGAVAVGRLLKFDAANMTNALGIAGSLSCGLLEFARSGTGAMVKRLHLGRAAESGVLAASLAEEGFTGPQSVLEGPFGFLNVYCGENDVAALTRGLGEEWATLRIMLKRFPRPHHLAHLGAGDRGLAARARLRAGRGRLDPYRRQPEDGDGQQHPRAGRPDDGAVFAAVLRGARALHRNPRDPASFNDRRSSTTRRSARWRAR